MLANQVSPIDIHIAKRLQKLREKSDLTRERLGELIGVSGQQIHKYELAKNRISASRLFEIAQIMKVPLNYFFDNIRLDAKCYNYKSISNSVMSKEDSKRSKEEGVLVKQFNKIESSVLRKNIINLVGNIAKDDNKKTKHRYS